MYHPFLTALDEFSPAIFKGHVLRVANGFIEATGPHCEVGDICEIENSSELNGNEQEKLLAEVIATHPNHIVLAPLRPSLKVRNDAVVTLKPTQHLAPVGDGFAGRLTNARGRALDKNHEISVSARLPLNGKVLLPLEREGPNKTMRTGLKAIDGLLTIGTGQRLGIFAASGVGKTTLLTQITTQTDCDKCVICLVGERGTEVASFWQLLSERDDTDRFSCVAATSDQSPILRVRAVHQALAMCEYWRDQGEDVLLVLDSVTRYAMALREIGLAAGAPPTLRAYTPNVFNALPRIVERCGATKSSGSITMIMTVLSETDDVDDPIVETMKSLLDGHIILSRTLADQGCFPAIDVTRSISRKSPDLRTPEQNINAQKILSLLASYDEAKIMIESGLYKKGSSKNIDEAIIKKEEITSFLIQDAQQSFSLKDTFSLINNIVGGSTGA